MPEPTDRSPARSAQLRLTVGGGGEAVVVSAHGELDLATVDLLMTTLQGAATDAESVVIDTAGVTFVDGAGMRGLLAPLAGDRRVALQIRNPSKPVLRLLSLLDCLDVLEPACRDAFATAEQP